MNAIIVTCAGCGKRYKGATGTKKFKCAECSNLFSYPDSPHAPAEGHTFCTLCWTEHEESESLTECSNCRQKMKFGIHGKATQAGAGAEQHLTTTPPRGMPPPAAPAPVEKAAEKVPSGEFQMGEVGELKSKLEALQQRLTHTQKMRDDALARIIELEANATYKPSKGNDPRIGELEGQLAQVCQERDEALEGMGQARAELDQYRAAAAAALEPLGQEYTRAMRELLAESDSMIAHLRKHAAETSQRTEELLQLVESRMNERVRSVRNQMEERLMEIVGTPPEQAMDQMPPVDDTTATKTAAETAA